MCRWLRAIWNSFLILCPNYQITCSCECFCSLKLNGMQQLQYVALQSSDSQFIMYNLPIIHRYKSSQTGTFNWVTPYNNNHLKIISPYLPLGIGCIKYLTLNPIQHFHNSFSLFPFPLLSLFPSPFCLSLPSSKSGNRQFFLRGVQWRIRMHLQKFWCNFLLVAGPFLGAILGVGVSGLIRTSVWDRSIGLHVCKKSRPGLFASWFASQLLCDNVLFDWKVLLICFDKWKI